MSQLLEINESILTPFKQALRVLVVYLVRLIVFVQYFTMVSLNYILRVILHLLTEIPQLKHLRQSLMKLLPELNPDIFTRTEDLIMTHSDYQMETHKIITEDGYHLTAWRIFSSDRKKQQNAFSKEPVILMHGLLDSSFSWFVNKEKQMCLPYILADQGYDVWCLNNRGNRYSLGHKSYKKVKQNPQYWNFGFDELVKYDVQANIKYVLNLTNHSKLYYIGHSQGSTQLFGKLCQDPAFQVHIKAFIALGPAIYIQNLASNFVKKMFNYGFQRFIYQLGYTNLFMMPKSISRRVGALCHYLPFLYVVGVFNVINQICGFPVKNRIPIDKISIIVTHGSGGGSVRNILQWEQFMKTGEFKQYDYGLQKNMQIYGSAQPPCYQIENLKKINIPIYLFVGTADVFGTKKDTNRFVEQINPQSSKIFFLEDYAHVDYAWGTDAYKKLYPQISQILKTHQSF